MARSITVIPANENLISVSGRIDPIKKKMAAYCRVSTDQEEQLLSYENQVNYYQNSIQNNTEYEYAGIYADEGISATNTKKRDDFKRMIKDCRKGKIDMIITKSISENSTWGIRRRFENGQFKMSTKRFLGYDTDEEGKLVMNKEQAKIVVRIYDEYLSGKTVEYIARQFTREGIKTWNGTTKWHPTTLQSMLKNEKYKGDAILQKSYTVDFLTKKILVLYIQLLTNMTI